MNQTKPKKIIISIILIISLILFINPVLGQETGSFSSSEAFQETYTTSDVYSNNLDLEYLVFYDIDYYHDIQSIKVENIPITQANFTTGSMSRQTPIIIRDGAIDIGAGSIGYGKNIETNNFTLYIYFDTWDIETATGEQSYDMIYDETELGIDYFKRWANEAQDEGKELGLQYAVDVINRALPYDYKIVHAATFQNDYEVTPINTYYRLNITKIIDLKAYQSRWKVYTSEGTYLNGTSETDESLLVGEAPIYLECTDSYDNFYSATIYGAATGTYNVHGRTVNAENNAIITDVHIGVNGLANYSNVSGYYQIDGLFANTNYNLTGNKTGYMLYEQNFNIGDRNLSIDIPLFPYGLDGAGDYNSSIPYLAGVVKNHFNYSSIKNCVVTLRNNSTTYNDITNSNGLFSFYPDVNGTYTLTVIKPGYYTYEGSVNIQGGTSANVALMPIVEEVEEVEEPPKTITDSIYHMFEKMGFSDVWVNSIIALGIIAGMGFLFGMKKDSKVTIMGMFMGFIVTIALGLLPVYFLTIVIIIVIAMIIQTKTGG